MNVFQLLSHLLFMVPREKEKAKEERIQYHLPGYLGLNFIDMLSFLLLSTIALHFFNESLSVVWWVDFNSSCFGVQVDKKYNHYCEQMQMVVNSFDSVMGFGAAAPYTALARKAMSRHFRCLKDTIVAQLKHTCELLGEKDGVGTSGITKGETPRLRILDQSLRQQRAFNQMGMMEQEAWRPQRGLPERSVNILRAWLFEHFLHPYVPNSLYQCLTLVRTNKKVII